MYTQLCTPQPYKPHNSSRGCTLDTVLQSHTPHNNVLAAPATPKSMCGKTRQTEGPSMHTHSHARDAVQSGAPTTGVDCFPCTAVAITRQTVPRQLALAWTHTTILCHCTYTPRKCSFFFRLSVRLSVCLSTAGPSHTMFSSVHTGAGSVHS